MPKRKGVRMFNRARNVMVENSSFMVNVDNASDINIRPILEIVAPNAILNAGGRADEVRCFPGTREEVISKVEKWINSIRDGSCQNRMMWLSGPAGAGKSAICQTVAERCPAHGQQAANFFFFRGDQTRNHAKPLVPTLVYQLRRFYATLDELLTDHLTADPLICKAPIKDQFVHLISSPIQTIQQSSSTDETIVLIVDGLDECDNSGKQDEILKALDALANADHSPFLVLIASRAEPNLIMAFNQLGTSVESIFLNNEYKPEDDIRRFVIAKFDEIKRVHHLRDMLDTAWPAKSDIEAIVAKSSGHFIYAATVMRYIQYSSASPDISLATIISMQPAAGHNPFAQLDAVYSHIFSKVHDMQPVKLILGASLIMGMEFGSVAFKVHNIWSSKLIFAVFLIVDSQTFLQHIKYTRVEIKSLLADLGSIIQVDVDPLKLVFHHASLHDYLEDKGRSGDYHLDRGEIAVELSIVILTNINGRDSLFFLIYSLQAVKEATTQLSQSLLGAAIHEQGFPADWGYIRYWFSALQLEIERLYFQTDKKQFIILVQAWICFFYRNKTSPRWKVHMKSPVAAWYYRWYCVAEGCKFVLRHK